MSVLIKSMKMPTSKNGTLIFAIRSDEMVEDVMGCYIGKAVPVPAHGRLIDADALEDELVQFCDDNWVYNTLRHAPTIIQAEEGE